MYADFLRVEVGVGPLVSVVLALELGEGSGPADTHVVRVEVRVNHQLTIVHQTRIVDRWVQS